MRRLIIAFAVAFVAIAAGLVCLLVYSLNKGSGVFSYEYSDMMLVNTQNVSLETIDSIDITYHSEDIEFYTSATDELILEEYMDYTPDDNELAQIRAIGSDLIIKGGMRNNIFKFRIYTGNRLVKIYLPAEYSDKLIVEASSGNINSDLVFHLSEFEANCKSGNITINEVYADKIDASASSGNIVFQVAEGNRDFSSKSGNIEVMGGTGESDFSASSGNITIEKASGNLEAKVSSGNITINDSNVGGYLDTTSGNIKLELTSATQDLKLKASSGDVNITLPSSSSFNFSANASSGDIRTFFDDQLSFNEKGNEASGTIGDNPETKITIVTSSGDIRVSE